MKSGTSTVPSIAAIILLCGVLASVRAERSPDYAAIADRLLIADFVNDTPDAGLGQRLGQVLRTTLEQSPQLALYPDQEIQDSLRQVVLNPFAPLTGDVARRICISERIPGFLLPRVVKFSQYYLSTVRLVTVRSGGSTETLLDTVRAKNEPELVSSVESVGRKLRRLLGEDERSVFRMGKSLFQGAARIPPALQLFSEATAFHTRREYAQEIPRLEMAVKLDPGFALAQARLAAVYASLGWGVPGLEHAILAKAGADETPPREQYRILGTYSLIQENSSTAMAQYEALARLYPRSWEAWLELGDAARSSGNLPRSLAAYQESASLNPSQPEPYVRLCKLYLQESDTENARKAWQQAFRLAPESSEVVAAGGLLDLAENDQGAAIHAFQLVADDPDPIVNARGTFLLAQAQIYGGRMSSAVSTLLNGIENDRRRGYSFFEADKRLACAEIRLLAGDLESAASECILVPDLRGDIVRTGSLGKILARAHRFSDAASRAEQLERGSSSALRRAWAGTIRGEIALASGQADEAIRTFREIVGQRPGTIAQESLARALGEAGLCDQADREYRRLLDNKSEVLFPRDGTWFSGRWAQILFAHAVCLSKLGKNDEARQQFRSYLWVFDGADPGMIGLQDARAFLRKRL